MSLYKTIKRNIQYYKSRVKYHLPHSVFLKMYYKERTGKRLNLSNPTTFNEKLQWLKLNYHPPLQVQLADKYGVRDYVAKQVGEQFLIPLYGVYDHVDQIDLDQLPERFVLKPNHGSGWVIICKDKATLDWPAAKAKLQTWMKTDYGEEGYEWVYTYIPRKIICEELLADETGQVPMDFKFFCTDGQPHFIQVDLDRFIDHKRNLYDLDWNRMPVEFEYPSSERDVPRPVNLDVMIDCACKLSKGMPFVRIDLYAIPPRVLLGEITFYPAAGYDNFRPESFELELGEKIKLPAPCRRR